MESWNWISIAVDIQKRIGNGGDKFLISAVFYARPNIHIPPCSLESEACCLLCNNYVENGAVALKIIFALFFTMNFFALQREKSQFRVGLVLDMSALSYIYLEVI